MTKHKKRSYNRTKKKGKLNRKRNKLSYTKRGILMVNKETDLVNTHLLSRKDGKYKESPGLEFYTRINDAFEFTTNTYGFVKENICKSKDKWFKFVIFNNDDNIHVFIISGSRANKHSVCLLTGLLYVAKKMEYIELRKAILDLDNLRQDGIHKSIDEDNDYIKSVNELINRDIPMMPVIVAGSGTYDDDENRLCINTKSGHYKPNIEAIEYAKKVFQDISKEDVFIQNKVDKDRLKLKYGDEFQEFSGICL